MIAVTLAGLAVFIALTLWWVRQRSTAVINKRRHPAAKHGVGRQTGRPRITPEQNRAHHQARQIDDSPARRALKIGAVEPVEVS